MFVIVWKKMSRTKFFTILFVLSLIFVFAKIYQHNLMIKMVYEKQRVQNLKSDLKRQKNELLIKYFTLRKQDDVLCAATERLGMQPLKLSQIITVT